jgi:hypothetical protein
LQNGLAIDVNGEVGTLGACVAVRGQTFVVAARHVVGKTDNSDGVPVWLWRGFQSAGPPWQPCQSLRILVDRYQPGQALYDSLDIAFLEASSPAANVVGRPIKPDAIVPPVDTELRYLGCRRGWVTALFDGPWDEAAHAGAFDPRDLNGIDTSSCGVVRLKLDSYDFNAYPGDSGSALWAVEEGAATCVGQLLGVSPTTPLGLILLYQVAFTKLGILSYQFV